VATGLLEEETLKQFPTNQKFDLIFLKEMVHLLPDPVGGYRILCSLLSPGGRILTINRPNDPDFPLFKVASFRLTISHSL